MRRLRQIVWRPAADEDLADIVDLISEDSPQAAEHVLDAIERSVVHLPRFPFLFRESDRVPGTREIPVFGSFLVFYRVSPELIEVVGVAHGRRQFPNARWSNR